jgi:hypothetical protein
LRPRPRQTVDVGHCIHGDIWDKMQTLSNVEEFLMEYKYVDISDSVQMPVPLGLTPDEEANYIASRMGFVDLKALEAECCQALKDSEEGKLVDLETVLHELEQEYRTENGAGK